MEKIPRIRVIAGFTAAYLIMVVPAVYLGYYMLLDSPHGDEYSYSAESIFSKILMAASISGMVVIAIGVVMFKIYEKKKMRSKSSYIIGGFVAGCLPGLPLGLITIFLGMLMTYTFWRIAVYPSVKQVTKQNN